MEKVQKKTGKNYSLFLKEKSTKFYFTYNLDPHKVLYHLILRYVREKNWKKYLVKLISKIT